MWILTRQDNLVRSDFAGWRSQREVALADIQTREADIEEHRLKELRANFDGFGQLISQWSPL